MQFHRSVPKHSTTLYWLNMKRKKSFFSNSFSLLCALFYNNNEKRFFRTEKWKENRRKNKNKFITCEKIRVWESRERKSRFSWERERAESIVMYKRTRFSLHTENSFFHLIDKGNLGKIENYLFCVCDNCNATAVP